MSRIAAVIVTYNRAAKLQKVLDAVLAQDRLLDVIVVIDNASTDETHEVLSRYQLKDSRVDVTRSPCNTGGAGGFAAGLQRAYELGADQSWLMDDDCYPREDALSSLTTALTELEDQPETPFVCSLVLWTDGGLCNMNNAQASWDWPRMLSTGRQLVSVDACSFVSVLIPRWALQECGLPLTEYFIWNDDVEFTRRLSLRFGSGALVINSVVVHDLPDNAGVDYANVNEKNLWKYKYGARNTGSFMWHSLTKAHYLLFVRTVLGQMRHGRVPLGLQTKILLAAARGATFHPQPAFPVPEPIR